MTRKWLVLLTIASLLIVMVAGCAPKAAPPAEKIVWKRAHFSAPTSRAVQMVDWFFGQVEERSGGRLVSPAFYSASLCTGPEQPDNLKGGLFQVTCFTPAYYRVKLPLYYLSCLPALFPLRKETKEEHLAFFAIMNEWVNTPLLREEWGKWDAKPISNIQAIFNSLMTKPRITTLEELKGRKIRAVGAPLELIKKAGGVPISIAVTEIYDALNKGLIEGVCWAWRGFWPYRLYEPCDYWTSNINLGHIPFVIAVREDAYESLPRDIKKIISEVTKEFPEFVVNEQLADLTKAEEAFKEGGIEFVEFTAADNEKIREMAKEIWKGHVDRLEKEGLPGRKAFNSLQDIMKKHIPGYKPYKL